MVPHLLTMQSASKLPKENGKEWMSCSVSCHTAMTVAYLIFGGYSGWDLVTHAKKKWRTKTNFDYAQELKNKRKLRDRFIF